MRYQFDLMMHSVVAELFKKVLLPTIGIGGGGGGVGSNSIFTSIASILRNRQQEQPLQQPAARLPTKQITPALATRATTTASNSVDVQKLLDNAQRLVSLQSLLRGGLQQNPASLPPPLPPTTSSPVHSNHRANVNVKNIKKTIPDAVPIETGHSDGTDSNNKAKSKSNKQPVQFAISTSDFVNFIQNNLKFKQNKPDASIHSKSGHHTGRKPKSIFKSKESSPKRKPSIIDPSRGQSSLSSVNKFDKNNIMFRQKANLEDFKLSHLTYIDTEMPSYGNQLLVQDPDATSLDNSNQPNTFKSTSKNNSSANGERELKSVDFERANRWNDVLVNMDNRAMENRNKG